MPEVLHRELKGGVSANEAANNVLKETTRTMAVAKQHLAEAQQRMKKTADVRRRDHNIRVGDDVVIKSEFIHCGRFAHIPVKICRRYVGPFQVVKQASPVAFWIGLP